MEFLVSLMRLHLGIMSKTYTLEVHDIKSGEIVHSAEHPMINDALFSFAHLYGYPKCDKNLVMQIKSGNVIYYEWKR